MENRHKYRLLYEMHFETGAFKSSDANEDQGLTDSLFVGSVVFLEDGSYSQNFWTFDGKSEGNPWHGDDLFKFWILMASRICDYPGVRPHWREFLVETWESFRKLHKERTSE